MAPGAALGVALGGIDVNGVSGFDRIVVLKAHQRLVSHYQAQLYADMVAISDEVEALEECGDPVWAPEMAAAEIRAALCRHDHCVRYRGWTYQRFPNADHLWTSPLKHTYTTSGTPP